MRIMGKTVVCRDKDGNMETVEASQLELRASVYGVIIRDGKVLLSRQWDGYDFPGGGIHKGELIHEALVREVKEETGVDVTPDAVLAVEQDFFISIESRRKLHSILLFYTCKDARGTVSTDYLEDKERKYVQLAEWVPLDRVDSIKFYNGVDSPALIQKALGRV